MAYSRCLIMKNKPRIRFKGFAEDWEQCKLRDLLVQPITDGPHETPELYDSGIPFISVDAIVDNKIDFTKMRGYISQEYDDICAKKYKPQINDVYLVKSGATIGKVAIVDTYDDFNIWSPLAAMRCGSITNPYFLYILLQTQDLQSQVFNKASHGTQPNLSMRQLEKFTCKVPKIEEQKLISRFSKQLDDVITLHQRKLEKLKLAKKALLQKLFPKNGSQFPEIRFKGFTDAWEQRKFDEIMTFINGRAYKQDELLSDGKYKVLRVGNFYTNDSWYYSNSELDDKYYAMNGDLLYTWSATFGPHIWKGEKVIYHYHIWKIVLKNKIDKLFALQLLEVDKANIMSDKNGSTMVHITKQGMENKKTILPLSLNEQKQISKFLSSIDKLITLHQCKLDKLQDVKKGLLQKMFV